MITTTTLEQQLADTEARLLDAIDELTLLRSGRPYHVHVDVATGQTKRCSSPYCVDLTFGGIRA